MVKKSSWYHKRLLHGRVFQATSITCDGKTMSIAAWAREMDIDRRVIRGRLDLGWSVKDAIFTPVKNKKRGFEYRIENSSKELSQDETEALPERSEDVG